MSQPLGDINYCGRQIKGALYRYQSTKEVNMKKLGEIELELSKLGIRNRVWGKPEVRELANILTDDETIVQASSGRYQGGFALLVATNHRLLLIDKKMWFMSIEDVRFDMITELDFAARLLDATISVRTINKVLRFTSMRQTNLRNLIKYLQDRIMEIRHMMLQQGQAQTPAADQPQPMVYQAPIQFVATPHPIAQPEPAVQPQVVQALPSLVATDYEMPATSQPAQPYGTHINYNRPSRLRRMGSFPTASLTTQHQRYHRI